ncbi:hypothetical protein HGP14_31490 [Rhizobium sp. P32RR-XVIII]|uniref:hypothetical protein n=1 Tax=Rhizobium sp. P32RR-XVIII TaxID=2726738 RepID=UPI001456740C|nr:hypothetical protein [Rhizobium sp. P32RR-XVIII]NLS07766.1 hypothetical protein [Rhizobium sp. P32RR-XVIII]
MAARSGRSINYLTLPAALASRVKEYNALAPHAGEADFPSEDYDRFPALRKMVADCGCGECAVAQGRLFCNSLNDTLGINWRSLNSKHGVAVRSETFDLVMANNLNLIHSGLADGSDRILVPICLVIENTDDQEYESWLADTWRRRPLKARCCHPGLRLRVAMLLSESKAPAIQVFTHLAGVVREAMLLGKVPHQLEEESRR